MKLARLLSPVADPRAADVSAPTVRRGARSVDLEMHRRTVSPSGVDEFLWPVAPLHYHAVRDAMAANLVAAARHALATEALTGEALRILVVPVLLEGLSMFVAQKLVGEYRRAGYDVAAPARGRVLRAAAAGVPPATPNLVRLLGLGPDVPRRWRAPARLARDLAVQKNIRRRMLTVSQGDYDIISTSVDSLPERHAGSVDSRVVYRRWHRWFGTQTATAGTVHHHVASQAVDAVAQSYAVGGEAPDPVAVNAMRGWLAEALALVEAHCRALTRAADIPQHLWTGSGGIVWNRMLQWAVRQRGGVVVGHDHGSGNGHVEPEIYRTLFEYEAADTFVTFAEEQAAGQRAAVASHLMVVPHPVAIDAIGGGVHAPRIRRTRRDRRPLRVMVLSSYYFGDVVTCEGYVPDLPMLDFEARLLASLVARGYQTIYKPHPLIVTRAPRDMAARLGAVELDQPSEQVLTRADVVVMLDPLSTAFATTLASGTPAVLVEFGLVPLTAKARTLLARRAGIVSARFDSENRIHFDSDALFAAIEAAPNLDDAGFVAAYYGASHAA